MKKIIVFVVLLTFLIIILACISQFAGEASLDNKGNIYFTHHFYKDGVMLEADIYVAYKK